MLKFALLLAVIIPSYAMADTGFEAATRVEDGLNLNVKQVTLSTQTSPTVTAATLIISSGTTTRPCVKIHNNNNTFKVALGSSTAVSLITGYILEVSTVPASSVELKNFSGVLFGKGDGTGAIQPSVSVMECSTIF